MATPNPTDAAAPEAAAQLGELFTHYRERLLAMLRRRIDPRLAVHVDPEDLLTNVFLLARRRWNRPPANDRAPRDRTAYSWFYRLALDCLIQAWRREVRQCRDCRGRLPWPEESSMQVVLRIVDAGTGPQSAAMRDELREWVRTALAGLSESDQEVLRMRHEDGLTHVEAAQVLGISTSAATVRYLRALRRIRDVCRSTPRNAAPSTDSP